jgi:hypothetical protein
MKLTKYNFAQLRLTSSTGRVLNLASVFENSGTTEGYRTNPLFRNVRLNKAIFLKHTLRAHERQLVTDNRLTVTKIVLPFDTSELSLGGYSFFVSELDFEKNLAARIGAQAGSPEMTRDLDVLKIIDALPTFDPFLLRERLNRHSISVARCYFDLSEADATRMRSFVEGEIRKIVRLAFAGDANMYSRSMAMTDKLMTDETAESLEPLRQVLQLSGEEYRDGIFAWKGFLYYSWNINTMIAFVPELQRQLLSLKFLRTNPDEAVELDEIRRRVARCLSKLAKIVTSGVYSYRDAYQALTEGKPAAFRNFLKAAPQRFLEVGEAFGMIMHIRLFWDFRFSKRRQLWLDVEEALDIFRDFDLHVSGIAAVTGESSQDGPTFDSAISARTALG